MMDEKTQVVVVRFPENLVAGLKTLAEARGWTVSRAVREAVREMVRRETTGGPSKIQDFRALL